VGQFPANFGRNRPQVRQARVAENPPVHCVLMAMGEHMPVLSALQHTIDCPNAPTAFGSCTGETLSVNSHIP
jgi:hypothetical protein